MDQHAALRASGQPPSTGPRQTIKKAIKQAKGRTGARLTRPRQVGRPAVFIVLPQTHTCGAWPRPPNVGGLIDEGKGNP